MSTATQDRRYEKLAARHRELIDRPEYAGKTWDWVSVAMALDISVEVAHKYIQWTRRNIRDLVWTVGTYDSAFKFVPTMSIREALPGLMNQWRHERTRVETKCNQAETLSIVDPDPEQRMLARELASLARTGRRYLEDVHFHLENIKDLVSSDAA